MVLLSKLSINIQYLIYVQGTFFLIVLTLFVVPEYDHDVLS